MTRKIIGYILLVFVFGSILVAFALVFGVLKTIIALCASIIVTAIIVFALALID